MRVTVFCLDDTWVNSTGLAPSASRSHQSVGRWPSDIWARICSTQEVSFKKLSQMAPRKNLQAVGSHR